LSITVMYIILSVHQCRKANGILMIMKSKWSNYSQMLVPKSSN